MRPFHGAETRPPAVAGLFYPRDPALLAEEIDDYLGQAPERPLSPGFPKVVIVPHAGYVYSGSVAASAYDLLRPARGIVRRVVLLGPCHRVAVRGLALPAARAFDTPLGRIPIDEQAVAAIRDLPQVLESEAAHAQEHALEVQLPFLQQVLGAFSLVPLVVGDAAREEVAGVLERLWGGVETLIVVSTDMSHYHAYDDARRIDAATVRAIVARDPGLSHGQACGATPLGGALLVAREFGLVPRLLDCRNSGDTAGSRDSVVGYASFALGGDETYYGAEHGRALLRVARESIAAALGMPAAQAPDEAWLKEYRASFVTLQMDGGLRGCIGSLQAERPLGADVAANARAAALQDPRFPRLEPAELGRTDIEVSLLSAPKRIRFSDYADLVAQLRPGADGVVLECDGERATFLPQVWEGLPDPERFLDQLRQKAGIRSGTSIERCRVKRYSALKWREAEFRR